MAEPTLEWNPEGKFTLLSIDGGGMRGVIPLRMLVYLEEQTGRPCHELFDMVAGTSTGSIIAAGIALKIPARQILEEVYRKRLPLAFGDKRGLLFWLRYLFGGLRHFYPLEPFVEALGPISGDIPLRELGSPPDGTSPYRKPIVLMTTKDLRTGATYYLVNEGPGLEMFGDWPVKGAVAASGAAPIFFPPVLGNLIDGGVGAYGNPCLAASIEAVEYIGIPQEDILHISLGTGYVPSTQPDGAGARFSVFRWLPYMILVSIEDSALQQVQANTAIYRQMDFRRYNPSLVPEDVRDALEVDAGGMDTMLLSLDSHSDAEISLMEAIGEAYARRIDWQAAALRPWHTQGGRRPPGVASAIWDGSIFV